MKNIAILERDIDLLKQQFKVEVYGNYDRIIIYDFPLPPNFNRPYTKLLLIIPNNFPIQPPNIFLPKDIKVIFPDGKRYGQFHSFKFNSKLWEEGWGFMCFNTNWDPTNNPGLIKFLQIMENPLSMVRADIENFE